MTIRPTRCARGSGPPPRRRRPGSRGSTNSRRGSQGRPADRRAGRPPWTRDSGPRTNLTHRDVLDRVDVGRSQAQRHHRPVVENHVLVLVDGPEGPLGSLGRREHPGVERDEGRAQLLRDGFGHHDPAGKEPRDDAGGQPQPTHTSAANSRPASRRPSYCISEPSSIASKARGVPAVSPGDRPQRGVPSSLARCGCAAAGIAYLAGSRCSDQR